MRAEGCTECERLWRDYAHATTEHIRILGKQRIIHLQGDKEGARTMDPDLAAADAARTAARDTIRQHEALAHDETADGLGRVPKA